MGFCRKFRTVILTDYIDAQLDSQMKERIDENLNECAGCRSFTEEVKSKLVERARETIDQNVNKSLTLETMAFKLNY